MTAYDPSFIRNGMADVAHVVADSEALACVMEAARVEREAMLLTLYMHHRTLKAMVQQLQKMGANGPMTREGDGIVAAWSEYVPAYRSELVAIAACSGFEFPELADA